MSRYIAFLRAINVGGHTVKMEDLRRLFEGLGLTRVETFIASGNVVFETASRSPRGLEQQIAGRLREALEYEVATFLRTTGELTEIAQRQPFSPAVLAGAVALNVAFLGAPLDAEKQRRLMQLRTPQDEFAVLGREIHWLSRQKQSESKISNAVFEKALGQPSTVRGVATLQKMAAKYGAVG